MIWIFGICSIAYIAYKIISCNQAIKSAAEYEMKEINSDKKREIIISDSTNKIDSPTKQ
jgi:hypothetical protein